MGTYYFQIDDDGRVMNWSSQPVSKDYVQKDMERDDPVILYPTKFKYDRENDNFFEDNSYILGESKRAKIEELNNLCNQSILSKFTVLVDRTYYRFSNDDEAQKNFDKALKAFESGWLDEVTWTAYNLDNEVIRINLTKDMFIPIYMQHVEHINNNISKFRDFLMPLVEGATTPEEVQSITW
jgi:hypothetical protein